MIAELFLTLAVTLTVYVYLFCKSRYAYFKDRGVKQLPVVPFLRNMKDSLLGLRNMIYIFDDIYNAFPSERIIGFYEIAKPTFMVRDPELIKQITVKDFDNFQDHAAFVSDETDQILASNLFSLTGDRWRDMRSTLSPAFTGSKIRNMCPFIVECGQQAVEYLKKECKKRTSSDEPSVEVELRDLYTRLATDVIATSAFGVKVNSLVDKKNDFFLTGMKMTTFTTLQMLKVQILTVLPKAASYLKLKIYHASITTFFKNIFISTVKYREENNIVRPDMINILMEVKKGSLKYETQVASDDVGFATVEESDIGKTQTKRVWTDDELTSQAFLFFFAGFDTVATMLSFTTMELALNPQVQDKLREEVDATYPEDGVLTYEAIQKLTYLDMVVTEGMRLWAPVPNTDRVCAKTYQIPGEFGGKSSLTIEKGSAVIIPTQSIHVDPKYWEEPRKFNPERFSAENKHKIVPFTYLPFGSGPRNCIGSRFALMEAKVIIYYLIRSFELVPTAKTMNPMRLTNNSLFMLLENGFWLKFLPRDDQN